MADEAKVDAKQRRTRWNDIERDAFLMYLKLSHAVTTDDVRRVAKMPGQAFRPRDTMTPKEARHWLSLMDADLAVTPNKPIQRKQLVRVGVDPISRQLEAVMLAIIEMKFEVAELRKEMSQRGLVYQPVAQPIQEIRAKKLKVILYGALPVQAHTVQDAFPMLEVKFFKDTLPTDTTADLVIGMSKFINNNYGSLKRRFGEKFTLVMGGVSEVKRIITHRLGVTEK